MESAFALYRTAASRLRGFFAFADAPPLRSCRGNGHRGFLSYTPAMDHRAAGYMLHFGLVLLTEDYYRPVVPVKPDWSGLGTAVRTWEKRCPHESDHTLFGVIVFGAILE
jgi:hypothetical protein